MIKSTSDTAIRASKLENLTKKKALESGALLAHQRLMDKHKELSEKYVIAFAISDYDSMHRIKNEIDNLHKGPRQA